MHKTSTAEKPSQATADKAAGETLELLHLRLLREVASPSQDAAALCQSAPIAAQAARMGLLDPACVPVLLSCAQLAYVIGQPMLGLSAAELAVSTSVLQGDAASKRKALTLHGILLADCGNVPLALEQYASALELARQLGERMAEIGILNNIGLALIYGALYTEAIGCLERSVALIGDDESLSTWRQAALANIALACIHTEDLAKGLRSAKASVSTAAEPTGQSELFNRIVAERNYTRLLLEVDNIEKARERAELAKAFAAQSGTDKAAVQAALAEGLYEVHAGLIDVGLSRLNGALERARSSPPATRDALVTMVKACEVAGYPEKAYEYLAELKAHTQAIQQDNALFHHRLHLARIESDPEWSGNETAGFFRRHERLIEGQQAQQKLLKAQIEQLERLAVTAELRDDSTGEHSYRVGRLAALLAREAGLDEQTCFTIDLAARLHDIGKIGIPDGILLKPGHLNAAEREIMETHTTVGAELLAKSDIPHMQVAEDIARYHHEWWAGGGYPAGISGEAIPIAARVTALADVFDALTHKRPYKEPWPVARALDEIQRLRGSQFDPKLTDIFVALIQRLQREVGDLDEFLGAAARESSVNQARNRIAETLRRHPERRGYDRGLDPRL